MRLIIATIASLLALGLANSAFAASAEDAAYDKNNGPLVDSRGNCVRTMWVDAKDPCAPAAPAPTPLPTPVAAIPVPRPPAPVVSREARTLYFEFNKAALTVESTTKLDQLAEIINGSTAITDVTIHGYTDQIGSDSYNAALAQKRVDVAKAYLDSKSRIKADGDIKGIGKANPEEACKAIKKRKAKITCMTNERRVEIEFNATK